MDTQEKMDQLLQALDDRERVLFLLDVLSKLTYSSGQIGMLKREWPAKDAAGQWDIYFVLSAFTQLFHPHRYLEIGTCRGVSAACVVAVNPSIEIWTYDNWSTSPYGPGSPNLGAGFVDIELKKLGYSGKIHFNGTGANVTQLDSSLKFPMVLVDGDHSEDGATIDLNNTVDFVAPGGIIVFDDIVHKKLPHLMKVWEAFKEKHSSDFIFAQSSFRVGCGIGMRRAV